MKPQGIVFGVSLRARIAKRASQRVTLLCALSATQVASHAWNGADCGLVFSWDVVQQAGLVPHILRLNPRWIDMIRDVPRIEGSPCLKSALFSTSQAHVLALS